MSLVSNLIPFGLNSKLERSARHVEGIGEGNKELGRNGVLDLDGVASGHRSRQCVVEREVVVTHHLHSGTARLSFFGFIPNCLRIQSIIIVLMEQNGQTEGRSADGEGRSEVG